MRISDWSSDVCSSDLNPLHRHRRKHVSRIIFALLAATIVIGMGLSQSVRAGDVVLTTVERTFIYADGTRETVTQSFKHGGDTKLPRSGTPIEDMVGVGPADGSGESVIQPPSSTNNDIN